MVISCFARRIFIFIAFMVWIPVFAGMTRVAYAAIDPLSVPNNKFGIHIISPSVDEASPAAALVNSTGGDWGYITVLVESKSRNAQAWQKFFDDLRKRHLIPIVRIATKPVNSHWERPYEKEYEAWADFLDNLTWPTKNRYVIIYNEPNHGKEWGLTADPASYAKVLNDTIDALKKKSPDFFVLNAGFDQSTPHQPPNFYDEEKFLSEMNQTVPGIFNKLDGWVSHSYPNPAFSGKPADSGKGSIRGWYWELQTLKKYGLTKALPVFITETGWKHSEGINIDKSFPSPETIGHYLQDAFQNAWSSPQIIAVTPFLLNYQEAPFDHFSFKKLTGEPQNQKILGIEYPEYYPHYQVMAEIPKTAGRPIQENKGSLEKGEIYSSLVSGQEYSIPLIFKNTGQSIWNDSSTGSGQVRLVASQGVALEPVEIPKDIRIEPNQDYNFNLKLKAPLSGTYKTVLNLYAGDKQFDNKHLEFTSEVKSPVVLIIKSTLDWKKDFSGNYLLSIAGAVGKSIHSLTLNSDGLSKQTEARYLLPGYTFDFTLEKPYYQPKTVTQKVESGVNNLDFGELQPDIGLAILNPQALWNLLPFSN